VSGRSWEDRGVALHTRLCDRFGIEHPIINAPMGGGDAPAELAAAVTNAGGLGMIGGTTVGGSPWLVEQIRRARELTEGTFGVGIISHFPNAAELTGVALEEGVRVIAHSFADPTPFVGPTHDAGALVLCQVRTVEDARHAAAAGVDAVTAQGTEAGGHTGRISTLPLVPAVVDAIAPVPVVAAGGIADGRGIAAALMLGADAVWLGTRFVATAESGVSDAYRERVVASSADQTILTDAFDLATGLPWPDGVSGRAVANRFSARWHGREDELRAWTDEQRREYLARAPESDVEEQAVWAGEAMSMVQAVEPAGAVVARLVDEATRVLAERSAAIVGDGDR
jgi:nitronate monooxygenase